MARYPSLTFHCIKFPYNVLHNSTKYCFANASSFRDSPDSFLHPSISTQINHYGCQSLQLLPTIANLSLHQAEMQCREHTSAKWIAKRHFNDNINCTLCMVQSGSQNEYSQNLVPWRSFFFFFVAECERKSSFLIYISWHSFRAASI